MEDLPRAVDLKTLLTDPQITSRLSRPWATSLGVALGHWLGAFHAWSADSAQADLAREMEGNHLMRDLKFNINYENVVGLVDRYPDLLASSRGVFEEVRDQARSELGRKDGPGGAFGVIHGDFWSGKYVCFGFPFAVQFNPRETQTDKNSVLIPKTMMCAPKAAQPIQRTR